MIPALRKRKPFGLFKAACIQERDRRIDELMYLRIAATMSRLKLRSAE
jgi:hypothetical protein